MEDLEAYDKKFAIILSKHLVDKLDNWPVSVTQDSLDKIRKIKESGNPPVFLSKEKYDVSYVEPKMLINPETQNLEYATVFQLSHK